MIARGQPTGCSRISGVGLGAVCRPGFVTECAANNAGAVRVGLVGCVKTKVARPEKAKDLYASALFRGRRSYVESTCDQWFVLSAMHGLLSPERVIEPYEQTLHGNSTDAKRRWAASVLRQLEAHELVQGDTIFEIHAGADYRDFGLLQGLQSRGARVEVPAEHLSQGEQLAFYAATTSPMSGTMSRVASPDAQQNGRSSYSPLGDYLRATDDAVVKLRFPQIERILGRPLPASARRHRAWWSNESGGTHSHASSWMNAGWRVDSVDFDAQTVRFRRG
jgi:hypothetical protein